MNARNRFMAFSIIFSHKDSAKYNTTSLYLHVHVNVHVLIYLHVCFFGEWKIQWPGDFCF